jgi:hypothetical protein
MTSTCASPRLAARVRDSLMLGGFLAISCTRSGSAVAVRSLGCDAVAADSSSTRARSVRGRNQPH